MPIQKEYLRNVREACAELRSRLRGGEEIRVEEILTSYPHLEADDEAVLQLIHTEVMTRHDMGHTPTLEEWQGRFPNLLGKMQPLLSFQGALGSEMPTLSDGSTPPPRAAEGGAGADGRLPRIANYHIIEEIGRGGMGVVYKARQSNLSRIVALKMILAGENAGIRERARLRNEAEAAAQLIHPNVVQIFEIGEHEGLPFLTMEYVLGGNLTRMLRGMPQAFKWSARMTETLARAIHVAHARGIVHRDLNPSNILMTPDGVPKITDFGLAKFLVSEQGVSLNGVLLGTPSYMAPEQVSGGEHAIGPATDVYALGALLYEMLTGAAPFRGFTPMETLCQVVEADLVAPSRLRHGVPADLETICLKCLDREPSRRYASAADLADDLRRFNENQPIRARRTPRLRRLLQWRRRQPLAAGLLAVSLLLTLLLLGGAAYHSLDVTAKNIELERRITRAELEHSLFTIEKNKFRVEERAVWRRSYDNLVNQVKQALDDGQHEMARELIEARGSGGEFEKFKGFEWDYLRSLIRKSPQPLAGHRGAVTCMATGSRPGLVVSGDASGTIILWDLKADQRSRFREKDGSRIVRLSLAAPNDSKSCVIASLAEAGSGADVKVWDPDRGVAVASFPIDPVEPVDFRLTDRGRRLTLCGESPGGLGPRCMAWVCTDGEWRPDPGGTRAGITRLVWNGDESLRAEGSSDGTVRLTRPDGSPAMPLEQRPGGAIRSLTFSRSGRSLAAGTEEGVFLAWDVASGRLLASGRGRSGPVRFLEFHQGDDALVGCDGEQTLWTRRVDRPAEQWLLPVEGSSPLPWFAISEDGRQLAAGGMEERIATWDLISGKAGQSYRANTPLSAPFLFEPGGSSLILGCADRRLRVWDVRDRGERQAEIGTHEVEAWSVGFSHDGQMLASGGDDHSLRIWDVKGRRQIATLRGHDQTVTSVAFAPTTHEAPVQDGRRRAVVASAGLDGRVFLWDLDPGRPEPLESPARRTLVHEFGIADPLWAVAFNPQGTHLAVAGKRGVISIWDLDRTSRQPTELRSVGSAIHALVFSPNSSVLASSSANGSIQFWDPDHAVAYDDTVQVGPVTWCLAFSPDGRLLAGGAADRSVTLWSMDNWQVNGRILGHPMAVRGVAIHPDQQVMATGCDDGIVRLWDLVSGQPFYSIRGHGARINAVAFSPTGSCLAACDHRGSVYIWASDGPAR